LADGQGLAEGVGLGDGVVLAACEHVGRYGNAEYFEKGVCS